MANSRTFRRRREKLPGLSLLTCTTRAHYPVVLAGALWHKGIMEKIDLPPVWLLACVFIAWNFKGPLPELFWAGLFLLIVASWIVIAALAEFRRAQTTVIPHRVPAALITGGIFKYSRNPIYLADVLILLGVSLIWGSALGLALTVVLAVILEKRFIQPEEARLNTAFGPAFEEYRSRVRKWI